MNVLEVLKRRLSKIGIEVTYEANYPWIYLYTVNGKRVTDNFYSYHGFTIAFLPLKGVEMKISDIKQTFIPYREHLA